MAYAILIFQSMFQPGKHSRLIFRAIFNIKKYIGRFYGATIKNIFSRNLGQGGIIKRTKEKERTFDDVS
jgi:hypothetical protein